jgi:hypothetical protein
MGENCVEYSIKELLPSKKAQRNYHKFLKDLNKLQKEKHSVEGKDAKM